MSLLFFASSSSSSSNQPSSSSNYPPGGGPSTSDRPSSPPRHHGNRGLSSSSSQPTPHHPNNSPSPFPTSGMSGILGRGEMGRDQQMHQQHQRPGGGPKGAMRVKKLDALQETLGRLIDDPRLSDVVFVVGNERRRIFAHKLLFAAQSEPFRAMLYGEMKESIAEHDGRQLVEIPDIEPAIFLKLQAFVYKGEIEIEMDEVVDVLQASHKYALDGLRVECSNLLQHSLNRDNVLSILEVATLYDDKNLLSHCLSVIGQHAAYVLTKEEFLSLSKDNVITVIASNKLCVDEIDVFKAVFRWRNSAPNERQEDSLQLMEHVRLPLISAEDLHDMVKPSGLASMEDLLEAMTFHASPHSLDTSFVRFQGREGSDVLRPYLYKKQAKVCKRVNAPPRPGISRSIGFFSPPTPEESRAEDA